MALTEIKTSGIADDAVTTDKLANAINTERTANTAKPSLANDANNRVVTGDGSGGLNGEANLTFDGNNLKVTAGSEGYSASIQLIADEGDDAPDNWRLLSNASDNALTVSSSESTERLRIKSDGGVEIKDGDLIIETAGHGINFHPHSGTDNLLDDYEIGTFTPTIQGTGSANACTYTAQSGKYTKVGRLVTVDLKVSWSAKTADSGSAIVNGLPFTIGANSYAGGAFAIYSSNFTSGGSAVTAMTEPSSGNTYFYAALVSFDNTTWNNESAVNMWENGTGHYRANFTYMV